MAAIGDVDDAKAYFSCPICASFVWLCPRAMYAYRCSYTEPSATLELDLDVVDWHDYYWGYTLSSRHKRRSILCPLPLRITDRVPQELFESIIDWLAGDERDLYNCALVCHAWYPRSTMLLYKRVYVHPGTYDSLARFALHSPRAREYLERTRVLAVCECVVDVHYEEEEEEEADGGPPYDHFTPMLPLVLGRVLPHLQCLSLHDCWYLPCHPGFVTCIAAWRELSHLQLYRCHLSLEDFRRVVLALPNLRDLLISGNLFVSTGARVHAGTAVVGHVAAPRLRSLAVEVSVREAAGAVLEWLAASRVCCQMEMLYLWDRPMLSGPDVWTSVATLVRAAGNSLKALLLATHVAMIGACSLRLSAAGSLMHRRFAPLTLDCSLIVCAPCLVHLKLTVLCETSEVPSRELAGTFATLLTEIASAQLRTLEVTVLVKIDGTINSSAWVADLSESTDVGVLHALAG